MRLRLSGRPERFPEKFKVTSKVTAKVFHSSRKELERSNKNSLVAMLEERQDQIAFPTDRARYYPAL